MGAPRPGAGREAARWRSGARSRRQFLDQAAEIGAVVDRCPGHRGAVQGGGHVLPGGAQYLRVDLSPTRSTLARRASNATAASTVSSAPSHPAPDPAGPRGARRPASRFLRGS